MLLNFDLDACAIGFDGSHVFMLPRCARAIETGYSVFTMDLVWGHHLGDRRASQDSRIFKYADRGFGIRLLPSYARSIEEEKLESETLGKVQSSRGVKGIRKGDKHDRWYRDDQLNRFPDGKEPGLKTLKRIAYLGQDYVHRFYFGATPLALSPKELLKKLKSENRVAASFGDTEDDINEDQAQWQELYDETELENEDLKQANDQLRENNKPCEGPPMTLSDLDTEDSHNGLPDGRRGLGNFEIFMRHCEAWRLHSRTDAT